MTVIHKAHALRIIRRAYGSEYADSVAPQLPERIDLDSAADRDLLFKLGLTKDSLFNAFGSEL